MNLSADRLRKERLQFSYYFGDFSNSDLSFTSAAVYTVRCATLDCRLAFASETNTRDTAPFENLKIFDGKQFARVAVHRKAKPNCGFFFAF